MKMQVQLVVCLFLGVFFVTTSSIEPKTGEDEALVIIECVRKALDGGLEAAGIPNHNPFQLGTNIWLPLYNLNTMQGFILFYDIEISGIVDFLVVDGNGTLREDIEEIDFNYQFHHHHLVASCQFAFIGTIADEPAIRLGSISFELNHMNLSGIWYQATNPNHLNNLTLDFAPEEVKFTVTGVNDELDADFSNSVTGWFDSFFQDEGRFLWFGALASVVRQNINNMWMAPEYNYRIDAILENCRS